MSKGGASEMGEGDSGYRPDRDFLNRRGEQDAADKGVMSEAQRLANENLAAQIAKREAEMRSRSNQDTQPVKPVVPGSAASRWARR